MEQRLTPLPLTCTQFPVYIVGKWWRSRRHHLLKILLYFAPLYGVYTKFGTDPGQQDYLAMELANKYARLDQKHRRMLLDMIDVILEHQ